MAITITQTCDGCGASRRLPNDTPHAQKVDGWRSVPLDTRFGDDREEQPVLCPVCRKRLLLWFRGPDLVRERVDALPRILEGVNDQPCILVSDLYRELGWSL